MRIVFTSHRVENIPLMVEEFKRCQSIVLEEPRNDLLDDVLDGKMDVERYVEIIDTQFPLYTAELLKALRGLRKPVFQIEPYLEEVEKLRNFGEGDERVRKAEKDANLAYLDYVEAFMRRDFEEIVDSVLEFAKADAARFVLRDRMRAKALEGFDDAAVEAGVMHTVLADELDADIVSIPERIGEILGVRYLEPPGSELTKAYIYGRSCDERLLAARSLVYISIVEKRELRPDDVQRFPHFVHEQKLIRFVNRLDYEKCRRIFFRLWGS